MPTIYQLIERQAVIRPDAIAVTYQGQVLTYAELNIQANRLAHCLKAHGIGPEILVGISAMRSLDMIVGILAVLKAGAAYLPIDSDHPQERINSILTEAKPAILLTQHALIEKFSDYKQRILCFDQHAQEIASYAADNIPDTPAMENLAYVLYTSGSTGKPKGVMVNHSNLIHTYTSWENTYQLTSNDSHLQMANFSFDVFSGDFIRTLCSGGKLVLCPRNHLLEPENLYELLCKEKINCAEFVPTVLRKLLEYIEPLNQRLDFMRLLICGSDNWSMNEYRKLQQFCAKKTRIINSYGLTEATIDSTYFEENDQQNHNYPLEHAVPIGKPFPHTNIYILNEQLEAVTQSEGEIYIAGHGVARGYLNQPELTQTKFITLTLDGTPQRLYKTGDRGRYLADGNIEFLGRFDNQIKLRGMRVELNDIENMLNCHSGIRESLIMVCEDEHHHKRLVAYLVAEHDIVPNIQEVRAFLQGKLPHYMIPAIFIQLDALPTTPNGKLDRQALKEMSLLLPSANYVVPRNETEEKLVAIWQSLLSIDKIGVFDQFRDLGGDSLLLAKALHHTETVFSADIPLCNVSQEITIAELANLLTSNQTHDA